MTPHSMEKNMMSKIRRGTAAWIGCVSAVMLSLAASTASAETLLMPKRDFLMGVSEVVWGVSTLPNGTAFSLDYGDGSPAVAGVVADRSYIAFNKAYATAGTFTATLTVGGESATVEIRVYDGAALSPADLRGVNINRAIQNGLRYQWFSQLNRSTNFPAGVTTQWTASQYRHAYTSLIVAAFQNHGYQLPNNNGDPTGVYEKYIVRRGLNFVMQGLTAVNLAVQPAGNPCVGLPAAPDPCLGFQMNQGFGHSAYETPLATLALATSGAPDRTNTEIAGITAGKSIREILQRVSNAIVWGQNENGNGRGGWGYSLNNQATGDGSTVGWGLLGLLDAEAAGAVVPDFASTEFAFALNAGHNNNGSLDYQFDGNPGFASNPGIEKGGIPLQGLFFTGQTAPFPAGSRGEATIKYIYDRWLGPINDSNWGCGTGLINASPVANVNQQNFGCAYSMYNIFKGLGLHGISQLKDPTNPAAPAYDWYAQYVDWLVGRQNAPTTTSGGQWSAMGFSCCEFNQAPKDAIALLILSPVVLVAPDPTLFSTVGLSPATATNPVGTDHTVTATAQSSGGAPIAGATVNFQVLTGPNAGKNGSGSTNAQGQATFTYTDTAGPGTDTIQAFIGNLGSNVVEKIWQAAVMNCDADGDKDVDNADLLIIRNANGQTATGPDDPRDGNKDGVINVADVRYCQLRKTS